jgi:bilin biosynthesis protein
VRAAVVGAIAKVAQEDPKPDLFEILVNALHDPDSDVRCEAASAMGNLSYQPALPHLIKLLQHPEVNTRKAAVLALMKLREMAAIAPLQRLQVHESEAAVQAVIKLAIAQLERQSPTDDWD